MKAFHTILPLLLLLCLPAKADHRERVYVHTDKDCYLSGETILLKFYAIDDHFQPSTLSKVGYIEICDTEKPLIQFKVALVHGIGAGTVAIPSLPTGIYQLSAYTRYMRNEGDAVFFKKQIALVNPEQVAPDPSRFTWIHRPAPSPAPQEPAADWIRTDRDRYTHRQPVTLSIGPLPPNIAELTVSVHKNDSLARVPQVDHRQWLKQTALVRPFTPQWLPEYEGPILEGRFIPQPTEPLLAGISFVGNDIRYFNGQIDPRDSIIRFHTAGIFGPQQIVTSALSPIYYDKVPYRIDLLSPFAEILPAQLPILPLFSDEKPLMERFLGLQIQQKTSRDTIPAPLPIPYNGTFQPVLSYDLDEYTRFTTVGETILEFISRVRVTKIKSKRRISVDLDEIRGFSPRTLVLLDGVPVYDHEEMLNYNPMHIKHIHVYSDRFMFGGRDVEGIVSFITRDGDLPFFQLGSESQLFNYDYPQLPAPFPAPEYSASLDTPSVPSTPSNASLDTPSNVSSDTPVNGSSDALPPPKIPSTPSNASSTPKPDFRHTLYWNPLIDPSVTPAAPLTFYTSDLSGSFQVVVEGLTTDGQAIRGVSYFYVGEKEE
jgi:hypothetical protein